MITESPQKNRKFKDFDFYNHSGERYYLLPFRFSHLNDSKEIIVNEVGDFLIIPKGTTERIIMKRVDPLAEADLYGDLVANNFISEDVIPQSLNVIASRYRTKKSFLDYFTSLHIFVISLRCDHSCHYCQVSRVTQDKNSFDMKKSHIDEGISLMMKSPNPHITMEFQGGEALMAFDNIVYAIEKTKIEAARYKKKVTYVICTNLVPLTDDILEYCIENDIYISTSLDGPEFIHNKNRVRPGRNSYEITITQLQKCMDALGPEKVSALLTTSTLSLDFPCEIVDEYYKQNLKNIFLRPISPYGFAVRNGKKNTYDVSRFLEFYKKAFERIIDYNLNGNFFREDYATIILKKILTPFPVGYVDLQSPAGMINNVIIFNYDGKVYATDESRMLAEMNDFTFQLGNLCESSYREIFYGNKVFELTEYLSNESLAGCSDCVFQSYCGSDPVFNWRTQGDMYGYRPTNSFCKRNMEIIRYLIELMDSNKDIEKVFRTWLN